MPVVKRVSRNAPMFQGRIITVYGGGEAHAIPVPDNVILCDLCNAEIETEQVNLLYLTKRDKHPYGAICEGCRVKSFPKAPIEE